MGKVSKKRPVRPSSKKRLKSTNIKSSQRLDEKMTKTSSLQKGIKKKQKIRLKHKLLMNKFLLAKKSRKEQIQKKNREKTAVVGDLKPLKDALPSLDELFKISQTRTFKTGIKELDEKPKKLNTNQKIKKRKKEFITKVSAYESLLNDPDFKKNPRDAIAYHIKCKYGPTPD